MSRASVRMRHHRSQFVALLGMGARLRQKADVAISVGIGVAAVCLLLACCGCASMPWSSPSTSLAESEPRWNPRPLKSSEELAVAESRTSRRPLLFHDPGSNAPTFRLQSDDSPTTEIFFDAEVQSVELAEEPLLDADFEPTFSSLVDSTLQDHRNFYSLKNLPVAASFLGVGAWMANTGQDQHLLEDVQNVVTVDGSTNEYKEFVGEFKFFGEGYMLLPIYAGAALWGKYGPGESPGADRAGEWGDRCCRAIVVGTPALLISQLAIGGSRPGELMDAKKGSQWQFMEDDNGVSGHAFMGAVPFLTAFRMSRDPKYKVLFFAASTLPALSRVAENAHYPSQALLGWGLAYMATTSVARTASGGAEISPYVSENGVGLGLTLRR